MTAVKPPADLEWDSDKMEWVQVPPGSGPPPSEHHRWDKRNMCWVKPRNLVTKAAISQIRYESEHAGLAKVGTPTVTQSAPPKVVLNFCYNRCGPYFIKFYRNAVEEPYICCFDDWHEKGYQVVALAYTRKEAESKCLRHAIENKWLRFCPTSPYFGQRTV